MLVTLGGEGGLAVIVDRMTGRLVGVVTLALAVAVAGCGTSPNRSGASAAPPSAESTAASPVAATPSPSTAALPAIVGEWVGIHDCERITTLLGEAGLDEFLLEAVYGNGLVPGATTEADLKDPTQPCLGAVQRAHSHFFTAGGGFGSRDFNGQQVDEGGYKIEGDDLIDINGSKFRFHIDGEELTLEPEPVDISQCTTKMCRFEASWVLMVAMPGATWTRGSIPG